MGNAPSTPEVPGGGSEGYHVLKVASGSPGEKAGLEQFFDFVIAINNIRLDEDSDILQKVCKQNVDKPVTLLVYSSKNQNVRKLELTPTANWNGDGLLGISIRFSTFDGASENIWHILDVVPASPSANAGLISNTDYIIAADCALDDRDDLFNIIESCNQKELKLYVYNSVTDQCRPVTVIPNDQWGGEGSLGCGIGYGYLHRIPPPEERVKLQGTAQKFAQDSGHEVVAPKAATEGHGHSHGGEACSGHGHGHGHGHAHAPHDPPPVEVQREQSPPPPTQQPTPGQVATGTIYTTTGPPSYSVTSEALPPQATQPPSTTTTTITTTPPTETVNQAPQTPLNAPGTANFQSMTPEQMQLKMLEMQQQMQQMQMLQQQPRAAVAPSSANLHQEPISQTPMTIPLGLTPAAQNSNSGGH
eukprot:m.107349 g.107349  ORF g.107349 m.107349 type:complete len:417 (-) comp27785_c0_seq1:78-1328(-)